MIVDILARYWAKVNRKSADECWPWTGTRNPQGYGQMGNGQIVRGRVQKSLATHIALAIDGRKRPSSNHVAMHLCDNPRCVNPRHLQWGTSAENSADMIAKGRSRHQRTSAMSGDMRRFNNTKLTVDDVYYIRRSDKTTLALAEELGVTNQCVSNVRIGRTWRHLK